MLSAEQQAEIRRRAVALFEKAGIALSEEEKREKLVIVDFGQDFWKIGIVMMTTVNAPRYCGRYILFFPGQSCAQHWHPDVEGNPGKEETFRCLWGTVYSYGEGNATPDIKAVIPAGHEAYYTDLAEQILKPGDQRTVRLHERHWFQAGPDGAIAYETGSPARDKFDLNSDPTLVGTLYE